VKRRIAMICALVSLAAAATTAAAREAAAQTAEQKGAGAEEKSGTERPLLISGSFVQPWFFENWSASDWQAELADLKAASVDDHIIVQWTLDSGKKKAWYNTNLRGIQKVKGPGGIDPAAVCLGEAQKAGIKVWLGLNWNDSWWDKYANDKAWLDGEFDLASSLAIDLYNCYKKDFSGAIAGFYIPMEVDNDNFAAAEASELMGDKYASLCAVVHRATGKPIMIAPFCSDSGSMNPAAWERLWTRILRKAAIDVINMQDGCGASDDGMRTHTSPETVGRWFATLRSAINKSRPRTELWSDLETFDMAGDGSCSAAADFGRIERQIMAEAPYVSRFSSYSVFQYQTRYPEPGSAGEEWRRKRSIAQYGRLKQYQTGSRRP